MGNKDNSTFMARYSAYSPYRLARREMGFGTPIGAGNALAKSLYCGMKPIACWDCEHAGALPTGGVFNLEFSPEGSLLVAACEKKSIQIFDPLTHQRIQAVTGAHSDCVNCVKFLDGRMFATCSDDTTIALWDVRNLKKKIRTLLGHSNWVKNIEFSVKDKLLVTSGLDGSIYTWDINSYTEYNLVYQRVFHASGLMRCRLSPDAKQMVMCTTGGLIVIIHDLNLSTLAQDLHGFKPNLYRLMQMSKQVIPIAASYDHLFESSRKENRVEFVSDFPDGNDAEVVSALQIHPQGWSALSRNISHDDRSEWSCIHDIQPMEPLTDKSCMDTCEPPSAEPRRPARRVMRRRARLYRPSRPPAAASTASTASTAHSAVVDEPAPSSSSSQDQTNQPNQIQEIEIQADPEQERDRDREEPERDALRARGEPSASGGGSANRNAPGLSSIQNDVWEASITIKQHRMLQELYSRGQVGRNFNMQRIMGINTGITPPGPAGPAGPAARQQARHSEHSNASSSSGAGGSRGGGVAWPGGGGGGAGGGGGGAGREACGECAGSGRRHNPIRHNRDRLLYYVEETNEGKGFIKELCYSADGRLVCSPFGRGMRLLALTPDCSELAYCVSDQPVSPPRQMVELGQSLGYHQELVVSSKFSPRHHLLVTGCLEGKIVWYEPCSGEALY